MSKPAALSTLIRSPLALIAAALLAALSVGILGRGYWTPDEPREADISWRMSWQADRIVPLLAGEAFCEKPPLTYWLAGGAIKLFGASAWAARLPNLLYALISALSVGLLARRRIDPLAGLIAAAAISTFLLSYQVAIWLATDAPLLAAVAAALLGLDMGFYATANGERWRGYLLMHTALACAFMSKSAAGWMAPALTLAALIVWERRWRELLRIELYAGLAVQALMIGVWIWYVYSGPDGVQNLKVFFWNNLVGRFTHVDAPDTLQYTAGHRNYPGKYLIELPMYLWPWTLLVAAALRRAWKGRHIPPDEFQPVRFALASSLPALMLLSFAATARNIYLAPALPGFALLLGWWGREASRRPDRWDILALRATSGLLVLAALVLLVAVVLVGADAWNDMPARAGFVAMAGFGLAAATWLALHADTAARRADLGRAQFAALLSYCVLLVAPAYALYGQVDTWQDLGIIGRAIEADARGRPLILLAPDETTRAFIDMYARTDAELIPGRIDAAALLQLQARLAKEPGALVVALWPGRQLSPQLRRFAPRDASAAEGSPAWLEGSGLRVRNLYALPNGRRYALLGPPH